jgi:ElaB/YqjD/DUF883 family membrane-anchored ribosome-binding protein
MASDQQSSSSMDPQDLQGMSSQAGASTSPYPTSAEMQGQSLGSGIGSGTGGSSDVMSRVVRTAHDTIDRLADRAAPHVRRVQEGVAGSGEKMSDQMEHWRETSDEWAESVRETVREHPIGALATALLAGMLIARLTR